MSANPQFSRNLFYRFSNTALSVAESCRVRDRLSRDWLEERALKITGRSEFLDESFREPLDLLIQGSRRRRGMNALGRRSIGAQLLRGLVSRLSMEEIWGAASPQLGTTAVIGRTPIYILGLPRTGTTLLHKLLSSDRRSRPLMMWESVFPVRIPEAGRRSFAVDVRRARAKYMVSTLHRLLPNVRSIHALDPTGPEECYWLLMNSMVSWAYPLQWEVDDYVSWLDCQTERTWISVYQHYLGTLQSLQSAAEDRHWVLKCPLHAPRLGTLARLVPEALFIQTYREISEIVASSCSLMMALRSLDSDYVDPVAVGRDTLHTLKGFAEDGLLAGQQYSDRVIHLHYQSLLKNPVGVLRDIYERFGLNWDADVEQAAQVWLTENPQGRHGRHRYALEDFGLNQSQIESAFSGYIGQERSLA